MFLKKQFKLEKASALKSPDTNQNRIFGQLARSAAASGSPEAPGQPGWPFIIVLYLGI